MPPSYSRRALPRVLSIWLVATLLFSAASQPAVADYEAGEKAYKKGDYETARREWEAAAPAGDGPSSYLLGLMYELGRGVEQDLKKSYSLLLKASELGDPRGTMP